MNIHIKNGRLIDPKSGLDAPRDVFIREERILAMTGPGEALPESSGFVAEHVIDAKGLVVSPGLVDLAARLREPGYEYKATLESELAAAAAGGVTSLACPPDTDPVLDEPGLVEMLKRRAKVLSRARIYPIGALTIKLAGQQLTEMVELTEAGCRAFSQANVPLTDTQVLFRALKYASTFGYSVWLPPQDYYLSREGVAHAGEVASRLGLASISVAAETVAVAGTIELIRVTGARVHFTRMSSAAGVRLVAAARAEGLPVSCDVAAHHLHFADVDIGYFDSAARFDPPLRSPADRTALCTALARGEIDAVCSDHTPVDDDGKQVPFAESESGSTGLELLLPLTLKWGAEAGLSLVESLKYATCNPAGILGIDVGHLSVGGPADLCVFDPDEKWQVTPEALYSQGKNTLFMGQAVAGKVKTTILAGRIVFNGRV